MPEPREPGPALAQGRELVPGPASQRFQGQHRELGPDQGQGQERRGHCHQLAVEPTGPADAAEFRQSSSPQHAAGFGMRASMRGELDQPGNPSPPTWQSFLAEQHRRTQGLRLERERELGLGLGLGHRLMWQGRSQY